MTRPNEDPMRFNAGEYAAIHLRDPNSGTPWLDEMITRSNKMEQQRTDAMGQLTHAIEQAGIYMRSGGNSMVL